MTTTERHFLPAMGRHKMLTPLYDVVSRLMGAKEFHWRLLAQAGIEPGATVLEIGCGTGNLLRLAKSAVSSATVIGLDPDPAVLTTAARKASRAGIELKLDRGYADDLPYGDDSVDRVLSAFMFHHLPGEQKPAALREARRVLKPGGRLHLVDFDHKEARALSRGHSHGAAPAHDYANGSLLDLMAEAGFVNAAEIGRGTSSMGGLGYYRADAGKA
ncbi:class I SAM-dependent methyltransferase [Umezawaea sp. Da 62-37]|uniref:class I SAM-dependent methyltransferase n=1 Tax=Umezawaea sp. Da 62-37 TaxID=3075927 RepID=UPI0028F6DD94|nr:class I SAM-dependent methyltransferase [Umezawaea sp. Da 62-37]WNV83345.1 class I SAM-dependent methyltransferase [Umezawaea sp. Da 62-37]